MKTNLSQQSGDTDSKASQLHGLMRVIMQLIMGLYTFYFLKNV